MACKTHLYELAKIEWFFERGLEVDPLDNTRKWHFTPLLGKKRRLP
jgi:V/A-type H+-transporting ATPase subunit A